MALLSASILAANQEDLISAARLAKVAGADYVHFDVMDGKFVARKNYSPKQAGEMARAGVPLDIHLMVENPLEEIENYIQAGARMISVHTEANKPLDAIRAIKARHAKAGIAINPATKVAEINAAILHEADFFLIMGVVPGAAGQPFIPETIAKIKEIAAAKTPRQFIEVDGGINETNAAECVKAGAAVLVAGAAFYRSANPLEFASRIKSL